MKNFSALKRFFRNKKEIRAAYLFGSYANGNSNKMSDIDIAVLVDSKALLKKIPYGYKSQLITELIKFLKNQNVDLVILNQASIFLRHQVISTGKLLYSRNEWDRVCFQADTMNRFPDIERLMSVHWDSK
ncbi:MAG: type VII toxin-antitoxin system MntA family adenylyltransferase antitoxin [Elusimicrobiota bacterium]